MNRLVYKMAENYEKCHHIVQDTKVAKVFLSDHQSKTQRYLIYYNVRKAKAVYAHKLEL